MDKKIEKEANNRLEKNRNFESSDKTTQMMLDHCFVYAFGEGADYGKKELIKKVKYWFKNIGPFVFPEDEETLDDLVTYLKK